MTVAELLRLRMANFQLTRKLFSRPEDLTVHLGAVQAQDFAGGIWALGMRMPTGSFRDIEAAIRKKSIIRTWSLRGTLHFLPATQARWILGLVYPRLLVHYGGIFRKLGLEDHIIAKSQIIIRKTLSGGKQLTRDEISQSLEGNGIPTGGLRSNFLFYRAAWEQLICFGPRRGKQFTFTLMDEWIPPSRKVSREEGITLLTLIYFTSHGPATIKDFSWWSGLGPQEAWQGIEDLGKDLEPIQVAGQTFYRHGGQKVPDGHRDPLFLLPPFDEYTVAFRERGHFNPENLPPSALLGPVILHRGKVIGNWKRTIQRNHMLFSYHLSGKESPALHRKIQTEAKKYGAFWGLPRVIFAV